MKTLRFIGMAFIAIVLSMSLYSCSDDDDDEGGGGGGSSSSPKSDVSVITTKDGEQLLVSSIKRGSSTICSFSYDSDGKLTYVDNLDGWSVGEVSYNPYEIVYEDNGTYYTDKLTATCTFNSNGYMTKYEEYDDYYFDNGRYTETYTETNTANISYDSSGHITKIDVKGNGQDIYDGEKETWTITETANFTWSSGNLTKASISVSEDGYKDNMNYTFTYGDTQNEYNQYLRATTFHEAEFEGFFSFGFIGYLGQGTAYLPSKVEYSGTWEEDGEKEDYSDSDTYSYTLNSNGTINTEKENNTTYTYSYVTLGSTRSALETPIAETLSAQENSKFKGIFRSIHERHNKHHTQK